jgi:hypothetical protein
LLESINTLGNLSVGDGFSEDLFHVIFLFFLSFFRVSSSLPFFNIFPATCKLQLMDGRSDIGQLIENWHDNELDEASLTSSDVCGSSIAHHGDV